MPDINITVAHKVAVSDTQSIVCDNSDYTVHWTLDDEWGAYDTKTMRTIYMDGTFTDKVFSGDMTELPVCTVPGAVQIGLFAGDIRTSRVAILRALPSVRSAAGAPADPTESVYDQLMERMAQLENPDWAQNDPTAKDYVRNRTHYVSQESGVVVPEQEVTTAVQNNFNIAILNNVDLDAHKKLYNSKDDTTFDVVFDGVSYPCKWLEQDGNRIPDFGNLAISNPDLTDTGEPFCVTPGPKDSLAIGCKVAGTHTVTVSYQQDVVHRLDPKYIGEISGETLSVTGTVEFASDSWASDYSYFTDSWLTMNANSAKISIEINGKLVEDLPYSPGGYGAFTFGNVDTLGVAITNSGYGTSTQRVTVSTTVFPNGIKAARVFRKIAYRIPVDSLPEVISWIVKRTEDEFVLTGNRKFVNDNEATQVTDTIPSYNVFDVYDHDLMLLKCQAGQSFFDMSNTNRISIRHGTGGVIETIDVLMPDGTPVTADNWPKGATLLGQDRTHKVYLLNPRSGVGMGITGATVGQIAKIAAVDASGVPTAWSPVDMPSGGGSDLQWIEVVDITTKEQTQMLTISTDKDGRPISQYNALWMICSILFPADATQTSTNGAPWVYPFPKMGDSSFRFIANVSAWKTIPRTLTYAWAGLPRITWSSAMAGQSTFDTDGDPDFLSGLCVYLKSSGDHIPAGTRVRIAVLSKGVTT